MGNIVAGIGAEIIEEVRASYKRATDSNPQFFEQFYSELFSRKEEYVAMFGDTDMVHQYAHLYRGIHKLIDYASKPHPESIAMVASVHSRRVAGVKPTSYLDWMDALLTVLSVSDPQFGPDLARHWVDVLKPGMEFMKAKY